MTIVQCTSRMIISGELPRERGNAARRVPLAAGRKEGSRAGARARESSETIKKLFRPLTFRVAACHCRMIHCRRAPPPRCLRSNAILIVVPRSATRERLHERGDVRLPAHRIPLPAARLRFHSRLRSVLYTAIKVRLHRANAGERERDA